MATRCTQACLSFTLLILFTGSVVNVNAIPERRRNLESLGPSDYFGTKIIFIGGKKTCTLDIFCKHISRGDPNHCSVSSTFWSVQCIYTAFVVKACPGGGEKEMAEIYI